MHFFQKFKTYLIPIFISILVGIAHVYSLRATLPELSMDFGYYIPRLLDSHLFYLKNGFSIQWYTPTFAGGLPSYSNPNQAQFSVMNLLLFMFNPLDSLQIFLFLLAFISTSTTFLLFYKRFNFNFSISLIASFLFGTSGFMIEHFIVGHIFFSFFIFSPILVYLNTNTDPKKRLKYIILTGFVISYAIYNAGFYPLFIVLNSILITILLYFYCYKLRLDQIKYALSNLFFGFLMGILMGISKLSAMFYHTRFFPRIVDLDFGQSFWDLIIFNTKQLFLYQSIGFFTNTKMLNEWVAHKLYGWQIHETDVSMSPVIIFFIIVLLINYYKKNGILNIQILKNEDGTKKIKLLIFKINYNENSINLSFLNTQHFRFYLLITIIILIVFCFSIANTYGVLFQIADKLPIIKSFNSNMRFISILILPLIFIIFYYYSKLNHEIKMKYIALMILFGILNFAISYSKANIFYKKQRENWPFNLSINHSISTWEMMNKKPNYFKIESVSNTEDQYGHLKKTSTLISYDPLYGFWPGNWIPVKPTSNINDIENGNYNFTNPSSLVFPEENKKLSLWDKIHFSDKVNFQKFINYEQPDWKISNFQIFCNYLSAFLITFSMVFVVLGLFIKLIKK